MDSDIWESEEILDCFEDFGIPSFSIQHGLQRERNMQL